jgi:hypothetical protein
MAQEKESMTETNQRYYSWREWDIATNREVRLLKVCADPFEPFQRS